MNNHHRSIRTRGGGSKKKENQPNNADKLLRKLREANDWSFANAVPTIVVEVESFFRDRVLPRAHEAREKFERGIDEHRERKSRKREEELHRNEIWRERAEQSATVSSKQNYASSSLSESGKTFNSPYVYSSLPESDKAFTSLSLKSTFAATRVLKLSVVAFLLVEVLDRNGILFADTPETVKARIEKCCADIRCWAEGWSATYANIRTRVKCWYYRRCKRWIRELEMWEENGYVGPIIWSTTKAAFVIGAACGMIATPLFYSWAAELFRPLMAIVGIAEANHYLKTRGLKFVELLGETPQTLGATLDGLLERCRKLVRRLLQKIVRSEHDCYCEGYGSGRSHSGAVDDRYGDSTVIGLMIGSLSWRKEERTKRSKGVDYSLGISATRKNNGWHQNRGRVMRTFDESNACEIESYTRECRAMAKQGLVLGCAIGLAMKGR